jgi:hypothetical protein
MPPRSAAICRQVLRMITYRQTATNNRSKFNVALGIESQGFCVLPR